METADMWPNQSLMDLFEIELPIVQAPMAGANGSAMVIAASEAGALGSLPCGMLDAEKVHAETGIIRQQTSKPVNLNFFCHKPAEPDTTRETAWKEILSTYYTEFGLDEHSTAPSANRAPFDEVMCGIVEEIRPAVVSFHFGLPVKTLLDRVKDAGSKVISSATTVEEAKWLADNGCDAVIAQGYEAGGHRGMFLTDNITSQPGTFALVPLVADAVDIPVIAAGGIADGRGVAAAFALGAAGVQIGTAYMFTPESLISDLHRQALKTARDDETALTNLFSGGPARGVINRLMQEIGPISDAAPAYPRAGGALAPLKKAAEANGSSDFSSLWSGQAAGLGREMTTAELTKKIAQDALALFKEFGA